MFDLLQVLKNKVRGVRGYCLLAPAVLPVFGLAACMADNAALKSSAAESLQADSSAAKLYYQCGGLPVEFTLGKDDKADMRVADVVYALEEVRTASGAKYQTPGDPSTFFWSKGNGAWLRIRGRDMPECSKTAPPENPPKPYRAQGNEPGWNVEIAENMIRFSGAYGMQKIALPVEADETRNGVRTLRGRKDRDEIIVTVIPEPCRDTMSGEPFAHRVRLQYNQKIYQGCGRSLIREVVWRRADPNGVEAIDRFSHITLTFGADGRLHGNSGCNFYNGRYTLEGERLRISPQIMSTLRACPTEDLMRQEQAFLSILPELNTVRIDETGRLRLSSAGGETLLFFAAD